MNYAIYLKDTGKIVAISTSLSLPNDSYAAIECDDATGKYVKDGALVDIPKDPNAEYKRWVEARIAEYKAYLASTDWYYARKAETGEDVPAEVATKRIAARDYIRAQES